MNNLGTVDSCSPCEPCCSPPKDPPKPSYPILRLSGQQVDKFTNGVAIDPKATYESTIRWRVQSLDNKYESMELCVEESDEPVEVSGEKNEEAEEGYEKTGGIMSLIK